MLEKETIIRVHSMDYKIGRFGFVYRRTAIGDWVRTTKTILNLEFILKKEEAALGVLVKAKAARLRKKKKLQEKINE